MSSRKRKRVSTSEILPDKQKSRKDNKITDEEEAETSQDEPQTSRPSRNRRKSAKLAEAEETVKAPQTEPQRLGVLSLHHKKGAKKDAEDSWTITSSSKPVKKESPPTTDEEASQLLRVVTKGKRQQTIKIKPLHKPEPTAEEPTPPHKQPASKHAKKSRQGTPAPLDIHKESNVSVKEDSGIKLKLILSPKDKAKSFQETREDKQSRDKTKKASKERIDQVKAKLVLGDRVMTLDVAKSPKQKRPEPEKVSDNPDKGSKKRKPSLPEKIPEIPAQVIKPASRVDKKADSSRKAHSGREGSKTSEKCLDNAQGKNDNKSKSKGKTPPVEPSSQNSDKKKKSKSSKASSNLDKYNLVSLDETIEDLIIDESKPTEASKKVKSKSDKKKKKSAELDALFPHKSHKHKSKDVKKQKAKFITTGTKKPGRNVGLDPVTASHMFGQFESSSAHNLQGSLELASPSAELDDESFFMASSEVASPAFPTETPLMGLSGMDVLGSFGKTKKSGKKSNRKGDKEKKKKKKKDKLKKAGKGGIVVKEKKPLSAYMLWCAPTRRKVVAQNPGLDFSGISRMMGTLWHSLPEKEKQVWQSKQRMQSVKHKNLPSLSKQKLRRPSSSSGRGSRSPRGSPLKQGLSRTEPIDCAAHLKLIGESLALVGDRLQNHVGHVEIHGSLSVMLDSTLCALAPLMTLTTQVPQLNSIPTTTLESTLDNIAYIMPGLG